MKKLASQRGFTAIEVVLGVMLVSAIGAAIYLAYQNYSKQTSATPGPTQTSGVANPTASPQASAKKYTLAIKELGIGLTLPASTSDLIYTIWVENGHSGANLSSASLLALDSKCTALNGAFGSLIRVTGSYNADTSPGELVKQFKEFHIVHAADQGCPNGFMPEVDAKYKAQTQALKSAYSSVVELAN